MGPGDPWGKAGRSPGPDLNYWLTLYQGPATHPVFPGLQNLGPPC